MLWWFLLAQLSLALIAAAVQPALLCLLLCLPSLLCVPDLLCWVSGEQGISVISAEGLLVEDSVMKGTNSHTR